MSTKVHLVKALFFSSGHVWMWELDYREKLSAEKLMLLNCGAGEDNCESLGLQGDQTSHPKGNQSWIFIGRTDSEAETPVFWLPDAKSWLIWKDWCWERLRTGGEGNNRGWDGWMASPTRWTCVWASSGSWWWTGKPGILQSMGLQRVRHDWVTELNWIIKTFFLGWFEGSNL